MNACLLFHTPTYPSTYNQARGIGGLYSGVGVKMIHLGFGMNVFFVSHMWAFVQQFRRDFCFDHFLYLQISSIISGLK
jgi:hypothetical protein